MIQYAVRASEASGADEIEKICNLMAGQGWRLVTASVESQTGKVRSKVWMFFEREVSTEEIERAARQFAATATR